MVLSVNLATAILDTSGTLHPVSGAGSHVARCTLTDWREPPAGEESGNHLMPTMSEKLSTRAGGERPWGAGVAIVSAPTQKECRTEAKRCTRHFQANPKAHISHTNPATAVQTFPRTGACLFS